MSFGVLMAHIAGSQLMRFEQVSGLKSGIATLPKIDAQRLDASYPVDWEGRPTATGRQVLLNMFVHTAHHRAQAEVYMRLKGIVPPRYTF